MSKIQTAPAGSNELMETDVLVSSSDEDESFETVGKSRKRRKRDKKVAEDGSMPAIESKQRREKIRPLLLEGINESIAGNPLAHAKQEVAKTVKTKRGRPLSSQFWKKRARNFSP